MRIRIDITLSEYFFSDSNYCSFFCKDFLFYGVLPFILLVGHRNAPSQALKSVGDTPILGICLHLQTSYLIACQIDRYSYVHKLFDLLEICPFEMKVNP
jgi:hypothetical protein